VKREERARPGDETERSPKGDPSTSDLDELVEQLQEEIIAQAREQYSETVVDHWVRPRNQRVMSDPDGRARIKGPCGDTMELFLRVSGNEITDASFMTDGCITSISSGSMAVEMAIGRGLREALSISQDDILRALGGLPEESRHCALLASDTLRKAVEDCLAVRNEPWKRKFRPSFR
jgi:nitrogen fixation NifU-like protein